MDKEKTPILGYEQQDDFMGSLQIVPMGAGMFKIFIDSEEQKWIKRISITFHADDLLPTIEIERYIDEIGGLDLKNAKIVIKNTYDHPQK